MGLVYQWLHKHPTFPVTTWHFPQDALFVPLPSITHKHQLPHKHHKQKQAHTTLYTRITTTAP